jgi:hypothetical protein
MLTDGSYTDLVLYDLMEPGPNLRFLLTSGTLSVTGGINTVVVVIDFDVLRQCTNRSVTDVDAEQGGRVLTQVVVVLERGFKLVVGVGR